MKIMTEAATFRDLEPNRLPKNSGMVAESRCWVMMRVRRPSTTQANREPRIALPMPAQVAAIPYFHPNCPAYPTKTTAEK